ncbi:MAG: EF-P lysine aminoacylase GenX [Gammaproteobacteria bacterium]|nr:EF-P lysine aminoacylase GenX [Gammaproteobacteria bacterium]
MSEDEQQSAMWRPSADLAVLRLRAELLAKIRHFFQDRQVLEVDTPALSHAGNPDIYIESFCTQYEGPEGLQQLYLQTSPEFAMKRLLASGSGSIYQICKAFRNEESSRLHNPEFTMIEWYRPEFDHHQLMLEVEDLIKYLGLFAADQTIQTISYQDLFQRFASLDPHSATLAECQACVIEHDIHLSDTGTDETSTYNKDMLLAVILTHVIEPELKQFPFVFVYDYPASQASLAKIRQGQPPVAERFELYGKGIELANGFNELTDNIEQHRRFTQDLKTRKNRLQKKIDIDHNLIDALSEGLPACAGVALGFDRLLMLASGKTILKEAVTFSFDRA